MDDPVSRTSASQGWGRVLWWRDDEVDGVLGVGVVGQRGRSARSAVA
jgi:hypothetical protein